MSIASILSSILFIYLFFVLLAYVGINAGKQTLRSHAVLLPGFIAPTAVQHCTNFFCRRISQTVTISGTLKQRYVRNTDTVFFRLPPTDRTRIRQQFWTDVGWEFGHCHTHIFFYLFLYTFVYFLFFWHSHSSVWTSGRKHSVRTSYWSWLHCFNGRQAMHWMQCVRSCRPFRRYWMGRNDCNTRSRGEAVQSGAGEKGFPPTVRLAPMIVIELWVKVKFTARLSTSGERAGDTASTY